MRACQVQDSPWAWLSKRAGFTTVGDLMNGINADMALTAFQKREILDRVRSTGEPVTSNANRIGNAIAGGALGGVVARMLGANDFWQGAAALGGAAVANSVLNRKSDLTRVQGGYRLV